MIAHHRIIDAIGVMIVLVGALCVGGAIGFQLQPWAAAMGHEAARQDGAAGPHVLSDVSLRQSVQSLHHQRRYTPDAAIAPVANGRVPVIGRVDTHQPVVFLTIDDGNYKGPSVVAAMKRYQLKASLFLADLFIWHDPKFFEALTKTGSLVENHTDHHELKMLERGYEYQRSEICGMASIVTSYYGRRPTLFRPPGGRYDDATLRAAADCGMRALVMWTARVQSGAIEYQDGRTALRPGDIVLMHFHADFAQDIEAFMKAKRDAKLTVELLEDWVR